MSFHATSKDIKVDNHTLRGELKKKNGHFVDAHFNLDTCIGNKDGVFEWGGVNFSHTARNIRFNFEGGSHVPVLRAELKKLNGEYVDRDLNLSERIQNDDGQLEFK